MGQGVSLVLFLVLLLACCGYALARGGAPERVAGSLLIGAFAIDELVHRLVDGRGYATVEVGSMIVDLALLTGLIVLSHRSTRYWPLWMAGWQLAAVIAHFAKLLEPAMQASGYAVQAQIWGYPMVLALGAGSVRHRLRREAGDPDPAWKALDS